jgi:hypothetical protein
MLYDRIRIVYVESLRYDELFELASFQAQTLFRVIENVLKRVREATLVWTEREASALYSGRNLPHVVVEYSLLLNRCSALAGKVC